MTARLFVLSGLPGAGKTTRARALCAETGAAMVARDDLRAVLLNVRCEARLTLLMAALTRDLLHAGADVVVDAWNLHPADRRLWERLAGEAGAALLWEHLDTPVEECVRRDAGRPNANGAALVREAARLFAGAEPRAAA